MKWKTHIVIARALSHHFELTPIEEESLRSGSVDPDRPPDEWNNDGRIETVSHHNAPTGLIMKYIWLSRRLYLQGDLRGASFYLGRALHYIQDRSVDVGWWKRSHARREKKIGDLEVPLDMVAKGGKKATSFPRRLEKMIRRIRGRGNEKRALRRATMVSAAVVASVTRTRESESTVRRKKRASIVALSLGLLGALGGGATLFLNQDVFSLAAVFASIAMVIGGRVLHRSAREAIDWNYYQ